MQGQECTLECTLDLHTIEAAVAGETWALEKVLEYLCVVR